MKEKTVLITGFDPFGGEKINPSWEAVKMLPERTGEYRIIKMQIPTVFGKAAQAVIEKITEISPDAVICVGQAGGRSAVTPEVIGINLREANIPDNEGNMPKNTAVIKDGPDGYFSTLPVRDIVDAVKSKGIPCTLSFSAGAFVCNDVLYSVLHYCKGSETIAGFIHVPYLPQQAGENVPSMPIEQITKALETAVMALK